MSVGVTPGVAVIVMAEATVISPTSAPGLAPPVVMVTLKPLFNAFEIVEARIVEVADGVYVQFETQAEKDVPEAELPIVTL